MSKHTPGPWEIFALGSIGCWVAKLYTHARIVKEDPNFENTDMIAALPDWSNAHLIAAAPDLLDALVHLLGYTEQMESLVYAEGTPGMNETVSAALDAIAKARGEA